MMAASSSAAIPSPHSHPGMMQQQQQISLGPSGQSPLARYMMAQSPQGPLYRPQMSPMNMISKKKSKLSLYRHGHKRNYIDYTNSPTAMMDDEMQFLLKFFTERIQYLIRIIARCQQEGTKGQKKLFPH